jgi:GT2 family glycosyltransferase
MVGSPAQHPVTDARGSFPADMDLTLVSRRPARLTPATVEAVMEAPVPVAAAPAGSPPQVSIVVVTYNNLLYTKLCLGSLIWNTARPAHELIVVDNGSADCTDEYLAAVAAANPHVRLVLNRSNLGFAPANNQGLAMAKGDVLLLLNNDTVVPPDWLRRLLWHLDDPGVGLAGPVTNRIGNEAEIEVPYRTYGQMLSFAEARARVRAGESFDIPMPAMFCLAMRRDAYARIGPLDERFEIGLLEDDDYARRARDAGYRLVCAEDAFVHHFGQASFGDLVPTGEYMRLLEANQRRFQEKWGEPWKPYARRPRPDYQDLQHRLRRVVHDLLPRTATVAVVSRGDEELIQFDGVTGRHFPDRGDALTPDTIRPIASRPSHGWSGLASRGHSIS